MTRNRTGGLAPGDLLGDRYQIVAVSGSGSSGAVYEAVDLKLSGKRWAVKEVRQSSQAGDPLIREASILTKLDHPCLPRIVDYFPPGNSEYGYLVTDFIDGQTVSERFIDSGKTIAVTEVLRIALQLCRCFRYLHSFSDPIIYRDLKPSNVMLNESGKVFLIDFGIARIHKPDRLSDTLPLGTLAFAAPEQLDGRQTDARTDLYGLGALMYYLLSGGSYYYADKIPLARRCRELEKPIASIVDKLLQSNPDARYSSARALETDLLTCLKERTSADTRPTYSVSGQAGASQQDRPRLFVLGSLFPGAGASYVSLALASVLNGMGIEHSLAEYPGLTPELYDMLDGGRKCPDRYRFLAERRLNELMSTGKEQEWVHGHSTWYPLRPNTDKAVQAFQSEEGVFRWMDSLQRPVNLVDLSFGWDLPGATELCRRADAIVWIADPHPAKFNSVDAHNQMQAAARWQASGKAALFIANKWPGARGSNWMQAFPWPPVCRLEAVGMADLYQCYRKGRLIQDMDPWRGRNTESFKPLIKRLLPPELQRSSRTSAKSFITRHLTRR